MQLFQIAPAVLLALVASAEALPQANGYPMASATRTTPAGSPTGGPQAVIAKMEAKYQRATTQLLRQKTGNCTMSNVSIRRSYSTLSSREKTAYLDAVKCLHEKPAQSDPSVVPGARNRMDDFTYAHINQTNFMHVSSLFLPWHRQFVWSYEQALRTECGYTGPMPYWDWAEHADDQTKSPVFDGTPTSFGGNGEAIPHGLTNDTIPGLPTPFPVIRPPGTGGGCVQGGGLGNFTVNLGPVAPANNTPDNMYGLDYNPRCLKRDFLPMNSATNLSRSDVATLLQTTSIHTFHPLFEIQMHPNAHSFLGGDGYDLFTSPNDPVFYLLHTQTDRLWSIWQGQDYSSRQEALDGTVTFLNDPPSANGTLDTILHMFTAGGDIPIRNVMSTLEGEFCYMYV